MFNHYQNNNVCDLDSISVHDIEFDLHPTNNTSCYGQFTYGDYLQELQDLEQGRTPMKIDRQSLPRDLSNLHYVHNVGLPIDQQPQQAPARQPTISLMVDPNTNMPVQFSTSRGGGLQTLPITFMSIPQSQVMHQQTLFQQQQQNRQNDLTQQQQNMLQHQQVQQQQQQQQQQKYNVHDKTKDIPNGQKIFPKPVFSYSCLIAMALRHSEQGSLPVSEIYKYMQSRFPYFKTAPDGWKNSVRHNLSLNKAFCKLERPDGTSQRKGCLWSLKPEKKDQLRREIRKWKKKHPEAIKASMANPDDLSLSSDSLEDDSIDETKTPSPEHIVPESALNDSRTTSLSTAPFNLNIKNEPLTEMEIKSEEQLDDGMVESAAKELFGNDLLFNQDDLQTDEFWNELIDTSENPTLCENKVLLSEDLQELESSIKAEPGSPSTSFFGSAVHQPTLAGF